MHPQREGHKHTGRWLAENMRPEDWLIDPFAWSEWYAGRTLHDTTRYDGYPKVKWVVIEEAKPGKNAEPHSRLPQLDEAQELKKKGELMYRWPEQPDGQVPTVCVYRVLVK
jgi:hypothetical protein